MPTEEVFLTAIVSNPADDLPRLVFADWLDERADPRGAFVRTAVAFDNTPPYDPARFRLADELRAMFADPAFPLPLPASDGFRWGWRRGLFALTADTTAIEVQDPDEVGEPLKSLWIERVEFDGYPKGRPTWERTFGKVPHAREVYFDGGNYGPDALKRLKGWPHLRGLRMAYLWRSWDELADLPHLRALTLDKPEWELMLTLDEARLPHLERLDLDGEWSDDLTDWGTGFPSLRSLTIGHYNNQDEQCSRFADCPHLRHLALNQQRTPLTQAGMRAIANAEHLRSLTIGPWPRGTIEWFARLKHLERLAGTGEVVFGLEAFTRLRWLGLSGQVFPLYQAVQATKLPNVARLDLSFRGFEVGAVAELAKMPALRVLTVSTRETRPSVAELVRLEQLEHLRFTPPGMSDDDLEAVRSALPNCRVENVGWRQREDEYDWG